MNTLICLVAATALFSPKLTDIYITDFDDDDYASPTPWTFGSVQTGVPRSTVTHGRSAGPNYFYDTEIIWANSPKTYQEKAMVYGLNSNAVWTPTTSPSAFSRIIWTTSQYWENPSHMGMIEHEYQIFCKQGSTYYIGPDSNLTLVYQTWVNGSNTNIVASDFHEINMSTLVTNSSSNPNFTTGSAITFGFAYRCEYINGLRTEGRTYLDNWNVELRRL